MLTAPVESPPLRIVQLLYSGLAGVGDVAFNLIEGDAAGRFDHALLFVGVVPLRSAYVARCAADSADYRYVQSMRRQPWSAWQRTAKSLRELKPDVIILHGGGPSLAPCYRHARRYDIPLLVVEHQGIPTKSTVDWIFTALAQVLADRVVALTTAYAAALRQRLGPLFRARKNAIIANGIDVAAYATQPGTPRDRPTFGMAARFSSEKRFDLLIDALRRLNAVDGKPRWRLSLAGDGDDRPALERMVRAEGLEDDVTFCGLLAPDALRAWYKTLDCYVHASRGETMSISLLQAMASGLPIVASDVGGIRELLTGDPPIGRLVGEQSGAAFALAIAEVSGDRVQATEMGIRAQRTCYAHFDRNGMVGAYGALIDGLER